MTPSATDYTAKEYLTAVVASPNPHFRQQILQTLVSRSWLAEEARGGAEALAKVDGGGWQALVLDRWLPDLDVDELVDMVKARHPQVGIFIMDSETGRPTLVGDLPSYPNMGELFRILQSSRAPRIPTEPREAERAPHPMDRVSPPKQEPLPGMIGHSEALQRVYRLARLVVPRQTAVLLAGETGTGKELVARAIHQLGSRAQRPFVVVNCAAIPETLLEAELFGYTRGAFTGAFQSRLGRIQAAQGGTMFLDEVGELPLSMQAKLLRFLQEGEVQRLGCPDVIRVDARIITATNADLARRVAEGRLREDLYYRLSVFPIELAPLRDRREDILPLAMHFLTNFCLEARVPWKSISPQARRLLEQHSWRGNVRELKQVIERAFILAEEELELKPAHFSLGTRPPLSERNLRSEG